MKSRHSDWSISRRPPVPALLLAFFVLLCSEAFVSPAPAADPAWFASIQNNYAWYYDHGAVTSDTRRGRALTFGGTLVTFGRGGVVYQSDSDSTHVLTLDPVLALLSLAPPGAQPAARAFAALAFDSLADRVWLFGGRSLRVVSSGALQPVYEGVPLGDLWFLDTAIPDGAWHAVTPAGPGPARRFGHSLLSDPVHHRLLLYGGRDSVGSCFGDAWSLDLASDPPQWSVIAPAGTAPAARWRHGAAFDPASKRLYVSGGASQLDSLRGTWALDLSNVPRWDSIGVVSPPGAISALVWDSRRGRLLGYAPGLPALLTPDTTAAAWHVLRSSPLVRGVLPADAKKVGAAYDAVHDQVLLPYAYMIGQTFSPSRVVPWTIALDAGVPPGAPANLAPTLLGADAWHGQLRMRWRLLAGPGPRYEWPSLERFINANEWNPLGPPEKWYADSSIAVYRYPEQPLQWTRWQLRWDDPLQGHLFTTWYDWTPSAPVSMSSTVDSADVIGGAMRLQWTLENDSLSYLEPPRLERQSLLGTTNLGVVWPDSSRHVRYADAAIATGMTYTWRLVWNSHAGGGTTGAVTKTIGAPVPYRAERAQPGLGARVRWSVPGSGPFTATVYRRTSSSSAWSAWDTLEADGNRDIIVQERGLPLNSHVEYRLGWPDGGVEAYTAAEVFDVPPFSAYVTSQSLGTHRVAITWSVWPVDSLLSLHVYVYEGGFFHEWPSQPGTASISVLDTSVIHGVTYSYQVIAEQGGQRHGSGATDVTVPWIPITASMDITPTAVSLTWLPCEAADAYQVWRSTDGGTFENVMEMAQQTTVLQFVDFYPSGLESLTYQLRWHEADGLWRALPDTTAHVAGGGTPAQASFEIASANPATEGVTLAYALPDDRSARLSVHDLTGRVVLTRKVGGVGARSWTIGRGELRPGVHWARFEHPALKRTVRIVVLR